MTATMTAKPANQAGKTTIPRRNPRAGILPPGCFLPLPAAASFASAQAWTRNVGGDYAIFSA
jgi:hypothetical protein